MANKLVSTALVGPDGFASLTVVFENGIVREARVRRGKRKSASTHKKLNASWGWEGLKSYRVLAQYIRARPRQLIASPLSRTGQLFRTRHFLPVKRWRFFESRFLFHPSQASLVEGDKDCNAIEILVSRFLSGVAPVKLCDGLAARRLGSATTRRSGDSYEIEPLILVGSGSGPPSAGDLAKIASAILLQIYIQVTSAAKLFKSFAKAVTVTQFFCFIFARHFLAWRFRNSVSGVNFFGSNSRAPSKLVNHRMVSSLASAVSRSQWEKRMT